MNLLCLIFDHRPPAVRGGIIGAAYGQVNCDIGDGIGRRHLYLIGTCPRCGDTYSVMAVHLPTKYAPSAGDHDGK